MRPIDKNTLARFNSQELVTISSSYKVLHYDEFPILYFGVNHYGTKIVGSHLEEDDESKEIWNIHTLVTNTEFYDFINGKLSYRGLLEGSDLVFLVEKTYSNKIENVYQYSFAHIPDDYKPTKDSYCPPMKKGASYSYTISLQGILADLNKAITEEVSNIQSAFADFVEGRFKYLKNFNFSARTLSQPYTTGSFKINLEIEVIDKKLPDLFTSSTAIDRYIQEYVKYISTHVIEDVAILTGEPNAKPSKSFQLLQSIYEGLYDVAHIKKPDNIAGVLIEDINKAITNFEPITQEVGQNFSSIEIANTLHNDEEFISLIDKSYSESFQKIAEEIEQAHKNVTEDTDFKSYEIYIYHLNLDSRHGNALVKNLNDTTVMSKPKIKILGNETLENSKYTESLHLTKWITVQAKAKFVDDKFKFLTIQFED